MYASDLMCLYLIFLLSNTDIIANSVIILFFCDLDGLQYKIPMVCPLWVKSVSHEESEMVMCSTMIMVWKHLLMIMLAMQI
jgi:hypothetical protein